MPLVLDGLIKGLEGRSERATVLRFRRPGFLSQAEAAQCGTQAARADVQKRVPLRALLGFDAQVKLQCLISHFY